MYDDYINIKRKRMDIDDTELIIDDDNSIRSTEYPTIYSWGRADLYCLLYKDNSNNQCCSHDGVYSYRTNSNRNIISISSNQYHTCCVTSTGELYTCGSNYEGAISDEDGVGISNDQLQRPKLFESLSNHKIVSVSCGLNHTVCLTSAGIPLSFGNNEVI
jgi:alpha-tubulin suppressor-like RCC1 family protein